MNDNDLISRALALEVINAVKGATWSQSGKVLCGKMYSQIKDLPAVDAVPVEWLFDWRDRALKEGMNPELVEWIEYILQIWSREKEQEAR